MNEQPAPPWLIAYFLGVLVAGAFVWLLLAWRRQERGAILAHEPRRPVPWGVIGLAPAALVITLSLTTAFTMAGAPPAAADAHLEGQHATNDNADEPPEAEEPAELTDGEFVRRLMTSLAFSALILLGAIVWVRREAGATAADLGLPSTWGRLAGDLKIGAIGLVACLAPIYFVMNVVALVSKTKPTHELLDKLAESPAVGVWAAIAVAAVVAAPLFEEFAFRVLMQSWLERPDVLGPRDESTLSESPVAWAPIVLSSLAWALTHQGQGSAPAPLFVLGLAIGYLYQRTHRVTPCLVLHGLFNAVSLAMAWGIVESLPQRAVGLAQ